MCTRCCSIHRRRRLVDRREGDIVRDGVRDEVGGGVPKDKNLCRNTALAELDGLVGRRHRQQSDLFLFQQRGNARCTVSICVSLHDTNDLRLERSERPDGPQVVADCCQIDLCYGRPIHRRRFLQIQVSRFPASCHGTEAQPHVKDVWSEVASGYTVSILGRKT